MKCSFHERKASGLAGLVLVLSLTGIACAPPAPKGSAEAYLPLSPQPEALRRDVEPGDTVEVVTRAGDVTVFQVKRTTADSLIGEGHEVRISDIARIRKQGQRTPGEAPPRRKGCVEHCFDDLFREITHTLLDVCLRPLCGR